MAKRDYYEVLGVTKGATDAEIKKAFEENYELKSNGRYELKVDAKVNIDELENTYPGIKEYVDYILSAYKEVEKLLKSSNKIIIILITSDKQKYIYPHISYS